MKQRDRFKKEKNYPKLKKTNRHRRHVKYLVRQAKKACFDKTMSSQTDNTSLIWKALNALTKTSFSNEHTIPNTFTAEVFRKHFLSLAETLTRTFRQDGGEYQCSEGLQNFCINRLKSHDAFSISDITVYKFGHYPN